jgi:hypothetical protein
VRFLCLTDDGPLPGGRLSRGNLAAVLAQVPVLFTD